MQRKFSIALFLYSKNKSYEKLLLLASVIYKDLYLNSTYPSPTVDMIKFNNQILNLGNRMRSWSNGKGTKADLAYLKEAVDTIRVSLNSLAEYVMSTTPNSPNSWTNANFSVKSAKHPDRKSVV